MSKNNYVDFVPVQGAEATILAQAPRDGFLYFATDTGKMYMDVLDESINELIHKPVGGSGAALYYIQGEPYLVPEFPANTEIYKFSQLVDEHSKPKVDDLLVNITSGKFLRVNESEFNDDIGEQVLTCGVLAISGTGGGGGGGEGPTTNNGTAKIDYIGSSSLTVLKDNPCDINYLLTATDSAGDPVYSPGTATWAVANIPKATETIYANVDNSFDIGPYLGFGTQTVSLKITINAGGDSDLVVRKSWTVTVTELRMEWKYELTTINDATVKPTFSWTSYGSSLDKTAKFLIDGVYERSCEIGKISNASSDYTLDMLLDHGSHTVSLWLEAELNGEPLKTDAVTHDMIFANPNLEDAPPIIVAGQISNSMSQYDTAFIPLVVYDQRKIGSSVEVIYYENGVEVAKRNEANGVKFSWNYTPTVEGYKELTIQSDITKKKLDINVEKLDLGSTQEVGGYAFKFKASEFNGNDALKNWNSNGVTVGFENFDWINGGLKNEQDDVGNSRSFVLVRAGSRMTINYQPFAKNITKAQGKCIKMIFKSTQCRDYDAEIIKSCIYNIDGEFQRGFIVGAQNTIFKSSTSELNIPYYEDTYIELEIDITPKGTFNYITSWIDGVPSGLFSFTEDEQFDYIDNIVIGSDDADVYLYEMKVYEKHLTDTEHLSNFIMDAPNATEMVSRFNRNNILDERGEIDPQLLALRNPKCRVHCYEIPYMTTSKDIKVDNCNYIQYHGSKDAVLSASKVRTRVQGTSSAAYGVAAFNLDADFKGGFDYPDGSHTKGWSMDDEAIPVSYFTTKVNVASCENANNALNQEWYNRFQPYVSPNRKKARADGKKARDCMQFYPGVLFIKDNNKKTTESNAVDNNVFKEIPGYVDEPYFKLYAVCNMGNSKKNTEVFHDLENPLECCIEVADNQQEIQRMRVCCGLDTYEKENIYVPLERLFDDEGNRINVTYEVHDKDGNFIETRTKTAYELWRNVNMSKAGFEFRYPDEFGDNEGKSFEELHPAEAEQALVGWFNFVKWMADCNPAAATNEPLPKPVKYGPYTFKGNGFADTLKGVTIKAFADDNFTTDSEKYRMAKMLHECEDHLVMDSVMFHYLFIERHTMVDNVAKNTFWSSGDAIHWDLTKNYDNDTADGNDNQGKLSLNYGLEPGDKKASGDSIFNAPGAVWLEFARRLANTEAGEVLFRDLEAKGAWSASDYCKEFDEWQSSIPERCWIEAYYRLYRRPLEVYNEKNYLSMLEGGKKTHQRKQYENYQEMYISSKYFGSVCSGAQLLMRPRSQNVSGYTLPIMAYADCYIKAGFGQGTGAESINYSQKVRRNEVLNFIPPISEVTNATAYLYPGSFYQSIGDETTFNNLGIYKPDQLGFANAKKLRKLVLGSMLENGDYTQNIELKGEAIDFSGNTLLEELYVVGYEAANSSLNLTQCPNLRKLDARKSGFTGCSLPDGAPITKVLLESPKSLVASNLNNVEEFSMADYKNMEVLNLNNVDNNIGLNSLILLKNVIDNTVSATFTYTLQEVKWNENDSTQFENRTIKYLEWLLSKTTGDGISTAAALTGKLQVTENAYNQSNSYEVYNKYCIPGVYPNLDIEFLGANAKMPRVIILNQARVETWSRRIQNQNNGLSRDFFSTGPNGTFIPFETTEDQAQVYIFTNKYKINGIEIEADENGFPVYNEQIVEDLIIEPIFDIQVNKHPITVYNIDKSVLLQGEYDYDTPLYNIVKDILPPRRDDSDLGDYYTYSFIGYNIGSNSTPLTLEQLKSIRLRDETELTAAYESVHVYLYPTDEAYFDISGEGLLQLKQYTTISGKVVIPKTVNNIKVTGLNTGAFQNGYNGRNTNNITHFFFEPLSYELNKVTNEIVGYDENTNITTISQYAFYTNGNLKMIELPSSIKFTSESSSSSFAGTNSQCVIVLNENMTELCNSLFQSYSGSFKMKNATDDKIINLPNLTKIGKNVFASTTQLNQHALILPNNIEFGGYIGTSAKNITFGSSGSDISPNLRFAEGVEIDGYIWGVVSEGAITLYGKGADNSSSKDFLEKYFTGTISTSN